MNPECSFKSDPGRRASLSAAGQSRKAAILLELDASMRQRNSRRRTIRASVAIAPLIALTMAVWLARPGSGLPGRGRAADATSVPVSLSLVRFVQTDPTIVERLAAAPAESTTQTISDNELRSLLAATGHEAGFVRTGGRVILAREIQPEIPESTPTPNDTSL